MRLSLVVAMVSALGAAATPVILGTAFVLAGDSTVNNTTIIDSGGWGNGFCASLVNGTPCINTAMNGATTGSFVASGQFNITLENVKEQVTAGRRTFATLQFGTNDQKIAPPSSMGANLTQMVSAIRAVGGEPVLITPLTRRVFFSNGTLDDTLGPWAAETTLIAQTVHTHLLDLHNASVTYVTEIGEAAAWRLNRSPDDYTHLNANGTIVFGRMVADLIDWSFPDQLPIVPDPPLTYNITHGIPSY